MDITNLPHDLFLLVACLLSPRDCVRLRAVNRRWHAAFTDEFISQQLLRRNFPRCRELRLDAALASMPSSAATWPRNLVAELVDFAEQPHTWSALFAEVARRYYHLSKGQPYLIEKLDMLQNTHPDWGFSFLGVAPWNRFLRLNEKTSNFHYPDPAWSYSQEDGLLVYPASANGTEDDLSSIHLGYVYRVLDLASGVKVPVPFDVSSKHIRRVRLAQGVLIFEWAEALPYHQLNDREEVHRHFATAFDVIRRPFSETSSGRPWTVKFRSEWKLHFLGLPLNRSDRFFSTHTATHYAVYFWQPNRSLYQDDPIEQLAVWDISSSSPYRPSEDPTGARRPALVRAPSSPASLAGQHEKGSTVSQGHGLSLETATAGPQVIRRMAWRDLDFYGLRQRATPRLRNLALDSRNLYFIEEEHRWADGQHSSLIPPRVHLVKSTGIPVIPAATALAEEPAEVSSPSIKDMEFEHHSKLPTLSTIIEGPVYGPMWVDSCGADGDVNMNFCQRVAAANNATEADTGKESPSILSSAGWPWVLAGTDIPTSIVSTQSTRWPGWAPCWRHEDFPYLTVTEMVDYAAGVRIAARRCFMLETLSVHMRPAVAVTGAIPLNEAKVAAKSARRRSSNPKVVPVRSKEVYLPDEMWDELVAKGHITGDERWVVGEDEGGRITIVRF
jgi:hypothetical protein